MAAAVPAAWRPGFGAGAGWSVYIAPAACNGLPAAPRTLAVPPLLREVVLRAASWDSDGLDAGRRHIAALIIDEIANLPAEALGLPIPREPRLQRIARALLQNPADGRGIEEWVAWASITPRTLSRRFPQETGFSFTEWRQAPG